MSSTKRTMRVERSIVVANAALALLVATASPGAWAQDPAAGLAACAKEKSQNTRLACFDALAAKHSRAAAPAPAAAPVPDPVDFSSKWSVSTSTSKIDDSTVVVVKVKADSAIEGWPSKSETPTLILRCEDRKTEAYIVTNMRPNVEYGTDGATITLRIDKSPAFKLHTSKSTDGEALFLPSSINQIKRLMTGSSLFFQFVPFNSSPQSTTFPIAGLAEAIKPLRATCKW